MKKIKTEMISETKEKLFKGGKKNRVVTYILLMGIIAFGSVNTVCYDILSLPPYQQVIISDLPSIVPSSDHILQAKLFNNEEQAIAIQENGADTTKTPIGFYNMEYSVSGIPIKSIKVSVLPQVYLTPGGHSIGILLQTKGVTVVGHSPIIDSNGDALYPAKDAGVLVGDFVTNINQTSINTNKEISDIINQSGEKGQAVTIEYVRQGQMYEVKVMPLYCSDTKTYRIGLYVRDNTAGVGTMTYYNPITNRYGALGHIVSNLDGNGQTPEDQGMIVKADIQGIKIGQKGSPGEKMGVFVNSNLRGTIDTNSDFGIFGTMENDLENPYFPQTIPVALASEIKVGKAQIYTVISGEKINQYDINIVKILPNYLSSGKGMIIEVTDKELLSKTGGIIQGMSGSPIVQNGYLVGAVTHVFVNDPTKGYACFVQTMLIEDGLLSK